MGVIPGIGCACAKVSTGAERPDDSDTPLTDDRACGACIPLGSAKGLVCFPRGGPRVETLFCKFTATVARGTFGCCGGAVAVAAGAAPNDAGAEVHAAAV